MLRPSTDTPAPATILIIDDTPDNISVLCHLLGHEYRIRIATNGEKGLRIAASTDPPDLILLDVMMPGMNGYEVCQRLKDNPVTRAIPVIFVTALGDATDETLGFSLGAVDYIVKPFNQAVIRARVVTHISLQRAYRVMEEHNQRLLYERDTIEKIIERMRATPMPSLGLPNVRCLTTPVESTTGDMLLLCHRPDGILHALVADFTGHGLPAAVGGPMVADIFRAMTGKNLPMTDILPEIDQKLHARLPRHLFLAAAFIEFDPVTGGMRLWNGGMPDLLLRRTDGTWETFGSSYPPLGVMGRADIDPDTCIQTTLNPGDEVFVYSDGIIETSDPAGEMFGQERLQALLDQLLLAHAPLARVVDALDSFRGTAHQTDDITLFALCHPTVSHPDNTPCIG
jgi:CheY-like chemotaxis protein